MINSLQAALRSSWWGYPSGSEMWKYLFLQLPCWGIWWYYSYFAGKETEVQKSNLCTSWWRPSEYKALVSFSLQNSTPVKCYKSPVLVQMWFKCLAQNYMDTGKDRTRHQLPQQHLSIIALIPLWFSSLQVIHCIYLLGILTFSFV